MSCSSPSRRRRATSTPCCSLAAASHTTTSAPGSSPRATSSPPSCPLCSPFASPPSPTASTVAAWQPCTVDVVYGEVYAGRVGLSVVDGSALRGVLSVDMGSEDVSSFVAAPESYCVFDGLEDADDVFVNSFHELETKVRPLVRAHHLFVVLPT
ncbi:UDP-glycosyltransferase 74E2 [Hordeum vulgare]|nr:UDP-glycosyltransferase 74E2 [Hordeum vulgare]